MPCEKKSEARRRELAQWFQATFQMQCARAWYRRSRAKDQSGLRLRIRDLAQAGPQRQGEQTAEEVLCSR